MPDAKNVIDARSPKDMEKGETYFEGKPIKGANNLGWGMRNRLSRLIQKDGHCFFLPIDHGYFQGPTRCLERPAETIKDLAQYADGVFVTRGVLRSCLTPDNNVPIILRVSGGTSMARPDYLPDETRTTSIEEIIRLNVSAVGLSVFIGTDYEKQTLKSLSELVDECETYGIPVMAVTAVGAEMEKREARYLAMACRIAAEIGAKIVKTYYCKKDFDKVVDGCPVPVVIAGGPKGKTEKEVFDFVYDGMQQGAIGINLGRNVWQSPHPLAMMKALYSIVHEDANPKQAQKIFDETKNSYKK